ncbi:MAG: T9SS type A sorting domain-containing protein [Bacteroidales bacterium]|nr:T9SS type A sorting domain-containing protein [Bacteroidales bacterium]
MKRKPIYCLLPFIMVTVNLSAQLVNINPDQNGDPWMVGDALPTSPEVEATIFNMVLTPKSAASELPSVVDNSQLKYMPPVFDQGNSGACVHVAELWYTFGYEINRHRNVPGGEAIGDEYKQNQYNPFYSYNFLNGGYHLTPTSPKDGFKLIMDNGCPSYDVYDDPALNIDSTKYLYWMNGYDNYQSGMHNKVDSFANIRWNDNYESLDTLKHWLSDHNAGEEDGGLATFSVYCDGWTSGVFLPGTPEELKHYITQWGHTGGHVLTIVGYHDDVQCFDIDTDGVYMNEDFDEDGIIQLDECEMGAFKVVNSWGIEWGDTGYVYVPYKLMAAGLQDGRRANVCYVPDESEPLLTIKTNVDYPCRKKLNYKIGFGGNANQITPSNTTPFKSFKFQGGCHEMRGAYSGPINVGLDFSHFYIDEDFGKIFFILVEYENSEPHVGVILNFSIADYRWGEEFELPCIEENIPIVNNDSTVVSIDYDLIVPGDNQELPEDVNLFSNMVSRFSPTVNNNAVLTVEDGVKIDMYNSELTIEEGSSIIIGDNVIFHASRGTSKIYIQGSIQIGSEVTFTADDGSTLELHFGPQPVNISHCHFENCIISGGNLLDITQSEFKNSFINQTISNLSISYSKFTNSSIIASNPTMGPLPIDNFAYITNCTFRTAYDGAKSMIDIYGYKSFNISYDTIDNFSNPESTYHGISINYSGSIEPGNVHHITNNLIYCTFGCQNDLAGITAYSSIAEIQNNNIYTNEIGIQSLNFSRLYITGNQNARDESETQRIKNNTMYQVFASRNAFPLTMQWNAIYGYASDCFVFHDVDMSTQPPVVNVENNYWGPNFDPDINLCPFRHYDYDPIWPLNGGQLVPKDAQQLFDLGVSQIDSNNYTGAKSTFQHVVTSYPDEEPSISALKELLYLEPLAGMDFSGLKSWYLTDSVILNHEHLLKISDNLANKCDEKLENYPDAIAWYENVIENPETLEDSIFAIIDLEHLYWEMGIDTTLRSSSYIGRLSQFKPKSFKAFKDHKDDLLLLLHGASVNNMSNPEIPSINAGTQLIDQLRNIPNPFKGKTKIYYDLDIESDIQLNIYNNIGQLIKSISVGNKPKGTDFIEFDASGFKAGIYFYSISKNGIRAASKKMLIL